MSTALAAFSMVPALIVDIAPSPERSRVPLRLILPLKVAAPASLSVAPDSMVRFLKSVGVPLSVPPVPETVMSSSPAPPSTAPSTFPPPLMFSRSSPLPRSTLPRIEPPETVTPSVPLPSFTAPSSQAPVLTVTAALPSVSTIAWPPAPSISAPLSSVTLTALPAADLIQIPYFFSDGW